VLGVLGDAEERVSVAVVSWTPPSVGILVLMLMPIAVGTAWGIWRGQRASLITGATLLLLVALSVVLAYSTLRPFSGFGQLCFFTMMGLIGPALAKSKVAATVVSILVAAAFVAGGDILLIYIACPLWGACI
jgi:hypothetical protein